METPVSPPRETAATMGSPGDATNGVANHNSSGISAGELPNSCVVRFAANLVYLR